MMHNYSMPVASDACSMQTSCCLPISMIEACSPVLTTLLSGCTFQQNSERRHGSTVVSIAASQCQGPGFDSWLVSLPVWSLHILPVSAWVSSGCSGFLPHSKNVRVIGHAKLLLSVRGMSGISRVNMWGYRDRA